MFRNGMRPVHPGEALREDPLEPLGMNAKALAGALEVPVWSGLRSVDATKRPSAGHAVRRTLWQFT